MRRDHIFCGLKDFVLLSHWQWCLEEPLLLNYSNTKWNETSTAATFIIAPTRLTQYAAADEWLDKIMPPFQEILLTNKEAQIAKMNLNESNHIFKSA